MMLDCGIAKARIDAWLDDELALPGGDGRWEFGFEEASCFVETAALESRSLGAIELERTSLQVEGDSRATEAFMRLFTLRFMSAGG